MSQQAVGFLAVIGVVGTTIISIAHAAAAQNRRQERERQRAHRAAQAPAQAPRSSRSQREWHEVPQGIEGPLRSPTRRPPINDPKTLNEFRGAVSGGVGPRGTPPASARLTVRRSAIDPGFTAPPPRPTSARTADGSTVPRPQEVLDRLNALRQERAEGLLDQAEFERQADALLERLPGSRPLPGPIQSVRPDVRPQDTLPRDLIEDAVVLVVSTRLGSSAMLQHRLGVGAGTATRVMIELERQKVVRPAVLGMAVQSVIVLPARLDELLARLRSHD